jgi:hypothetical protein
MVELSAGARLEARAQRFFLAQGLFAERELLPAATPDRRMIATDIDVLVSEYGSGFHLTRRHVECKSGKFSLLDRILWLNGVRTLLRADSSYLIASDADLDASDFARRLEVQLFTGQHLEKWEKAIGTPVDVWPCRSDFVTFDCARSVWSQLSKSDEAWRLLRGGLAFVEVESWLTFRYRLLNKLLRMIEEVARLVDAGGLDNDQILCAKYLFSALLVRLSQYVLAICEDVGTIMPVEIESYLTQRLMFGDQDAFQATELTKATVAWVRESLQVKGIAMPSEIDPGRLNVPPPYAPEVVSLVKRLLDQSQEARYLPIAVERMQFGLEADDKLPRLRMAAGAGDTLAALLKAFVARAFKVSATLAAPVHAELISAYKGRVTNQSESPAKAGRQPNSWSVSHNKDKRPAFGESQKVEKKAVSQVSGETKKPEQGDLLKSPEEESK